jgi:hypothetical protein
VRSLSLVGAVASWGRAGCHAGQIGANGLVEMDETFVGGKAKNMRKAKRVKAIRAEGTFKGKTIVVGVLERGGRVRAEVVEARSREILHELARTSIAPGATVITDEHHPYRGIEFVHEVINHAESYVRGHIHTNGIESFWSLIRSEIFSKACSAICLGADILSPFCNCSSGPNGA